MGTKHKRAKQRFSKAERALIEDVNRSIKPFGVATALGPEAVGVMGDARAVGLAVVVRFIADADVLELSTRITNRVRGVARVLVEVP